MTPRETYHHGELALALVEAAVRLVEDGGIESFSLRAAARAVEVDPSAVYRHYRDKAALLGAVAVRGFEQMADGIEAELVGAETPQEQFRAIGRAYVRHAVAHPATFRVMFGPFGAGGSTWAEVKARHGQTRSAFDMVVGVLAKFPLRDEPREAAIVAWSAVHGLAALAVDANLRNHGPEAVEAHLERVVRTVATGLVLETG